MAIGVRRGEYNRRLMHKIFAVRIIYHIRSISYCKRPGVYEECFYSYVVTKQ